ncbi:hypothetical protein HCAG_00222 [Histoplasma mississippiense (nom. inval.)]|uniref:hypothetical protein n=1 Tax=Ajellomyces capsulatus (strain NAm1 / WU24) TaxID=2059318 RepID=UPI000157B4B4|nr:hypothetical protein HCAG_00222 [Histoplasma mississippiense (nom. inval.)]EDN02358.1 hypothetical protein HCAG_00222 [Histoplasma mississippiense (nom. inval.)]
MANESTGRSTGGGEPSGSHTRRTSDGDDVSELATTYNRLVAQGFPAELAAQVAQQRWAAKMGITLSTGSSNNGGSMSALKEFKDEHDHVSLSLNEKLAGASNFEAFKREVMARAVLLEANTILTKYEEQAPEDSTPDESKIWSYKNRRMWECIWNNMKSNAQTLAQSKLQGDEETGKMGNTAALWRALELEYQVHAADHQNTLYSRISHMNIYWHGGDLTPFVQDWRQTVNEIAAKGWALPDAYLRQRFVDALKTHNQDWVQNYLKNLRNGHDKNHIPVYDLDDLIDELIRLKTVVKKDTGKGMQSKKANDSEKECSQSSNTLTTKNSKELNTSQNTNPSTSQNTQNSQRSDKERTGVKCHYCSYPGHIKKDCHYKNWRDQSEEWQQSRKAKIEELAKKNGEEPPEFQSSLKGLAALRPQRDPNWYLDTGCSGNITPNMEVLSSLRPSDDGNFAEDANGGSIRTKAVGEANVMLNGSTLRLNETNYTPDVASNLVSFGQLLCDGFDFELLRGEDSKMYGFKIKAPDGEVFYATINNSRVFPIHGTKEAAIAAVAKSVVPNLANTLFAWHVRLGHLNERDILKLAKDPQSGIVIKGDLKMPFCETCKLSKAKTKISRIPMPRAKNRGYRIHFDLAGGGESLGDGLNVFSPSNQGYKYALLVVDDATRYKFTYFLRAKSEAPDAVEFHLKHLKGLGVNVAFARSDFATEIGGQKTQNVLTKHGVKWEPTEPYAPWQDGVSERAIQDVAMKARTMMVQAGLPPEMWAECMLTATLISNITPTSTELYSEIVPEGRWSSMTSFEAWDGKPYKRASALRAIGTPCYALKVGNQKEKSKFAARSERHILIGYYGGYAYRLWNPTTKEVVVSSSVEFNESATLNRLVGPALDDRKTSEISYNTPSGEPEKVDQQISYNPPVPEDSTLQTEITPAEQPKKDQLFPSAQGTTGKKRGRPKDEDGKITSYKARWVVQGFRQKKGVDYDLTYAPVISADTIRTIFAVAASKGWKIRQIDFVTAFLNAELPEGERPYMQQPKGFEVGDPEKNAPRNWFNLITSYLGKIGFVASEWDSGLWYNREKQVYLTLYVDDMKLVGPDEGALEDTAKLIAKEFNIKDLGEARHYLGMKVERGDEGICLSQEVYIDQALKKFNMTECNPVRTPMDPGFAPEGGDPFDESLYRAAVGTLQHLATYTRPDIAFAVGYLGRWASKPTTACWAAVKHLLRYLKGTKSLRIIYRHTAEVGTKLNAFSDSDWAGDVGDRKSTSGMVILLAGGPISWKSSKQGVVALSTTEAEYVACSEALKTVIRIRGLLNELGLADGSSPAPTIMNIDNTGAIAVANGEKVTRNVRHIDIRFHHVRDEVRKGTIKLCHIESAGMAADCLTKALSYEMNTRAIEMLGLVG